MFKNSPHSCTQHMQTVRREWVEESVGCLIPSLALQKHGNQHERNIHSGGVRSPALALMFSRTSASPGSLEILQSTLRPGCPLLPCSGCPAQGQAVEASKLPGRRCARSLLNRGNAAKRSQTILALFLGLHCLRAWWEAAREEQCRRSASLAGWAAGISEADTNKCISC